MKKLICYVANRDLKFHSNDLQMPRYKVVFIGTSQKWDQTQIKSFRLPKCQATSLLNEDT